MSDKYKQSERFEETLRYLNDAMTNEERYSFERELERDPFMQEAFEGLSNIRASEIEKDIRSLDIISGKKRKSIFFVKVLAYAVGVALLFSLGYWAFQSIDFSKPQIAKSTDESDKLQLREPYKPPATQTTDSSTVDSTDDFMSDAGMDQSNAGNNLSQPTDKNSIVAGKGSLSKTDQATTKDLNKKKPTIKVIGEKPQPAHTNDTDKTPEIKNDTEKSETESAKQSVLGSQDNEQDSEDNSEPENALKRPGVNAEPQPLGGATLFKDYIEKNAKYPKGIQNARKEFVKVKFKISKVGQPYGIVVEKSPDQEFSQEAIRLILEGPKWSPEIKDGIPVVGEVSMKINFKP